MAVSVKGVRCPQEVILMEGRWYAGVSAEHAPCRSTHGRTGGGGGSLHDEPGGIHYSPQLEAAFHRCKRPAWGRGREGLTAAD